jgi:hypothetical protein
MQPEAWSLNHPPHPQPPQERLGSAATVATILCDDNKKYLSTALARPEPQKRAYLSQARPRATALRFCARWRAFLRTMVRAPAECRACGS